MHFECPNCKKSGQVDDSKIPVTGMHATCPQCNNKFLIKPEAPKDFIFEPIKEKSKLDDFVDTVKAKIQNPQETHADLPLTGYPWRRYWARTIDMLMLWIPIVYLLGYFLPSYFTLIIESSGGIKNSAFTIYMAVLPFVMLGEAIIMGTTGTTFGKWLLNINIVRKQDGDKLSFSEAFERCFLIWIKGLGLGFPLVSIFTMLVAGNNIKKNINASWDDSVSADVQCGPLSALKVSLSVFSLVVLFVAIGNLNKIVKSDNLGTRQAIQRSDTLSSTTSPTLDRIYRNGELICFKDGTNYTVVNEGPFSAQLPGIFNKATESDILSVLAPNPRTPSSLSANNQTIGKVYKPGEIIKFDDGSVYTVEYEGDIFTQIAEINNKKRCLTQGKHTYDYIHPITGKTVTVTGDTPPDKATLDEIFRRTTPQSTAP